jgi:hypothetical protein
VVQYHENHVIGILDTPEAAEAAVRALTGGGFLESEVTLTCGAERADRLRASGGQTGVIGRVLQVVDRFGGGGEEMDARHRGGDAQATWRALHRLLRSPHHREAGVGRSAKVVAEPLALASASPHRT